MRNSLIVCFLYKIVYIVVLISNLTNYLTVGFTYSYKIVYTWKKILNKWIQRYWF